MRVAVVGASGSVGQRVVREAVAEGHVVTAVARGAGRLRGAFADLVGVTTSTADVNRPAELAKVIQGHDALVSTVGPSARDGDETTPLTEVARRLIEAARTAQVPRLVHVCWEQALCVASGSLVDAPSLPGDSWRAVARSRSELFHVFRAAADLDCTFVAPAAFVDHGPRTGGHLRGGGALIVDSTGKGRISIDDFAVAIVDELQKPRELRQRYVLISYG